MDQVYECRTNDLRQMTQTGVVVFFSIKQKVCKIALHLIYELR